MRKKILLVFGSILILLSLLLIYLVEKRQTKKLSSAETMNSYFLEDLRMVSTPYIPEVNNSTKKVNHMKKVKAESLFLDNSCYLEMAEYSDSRGKEVEVYQVGPFYFDKSYPVPALTWILLHFERTRILDSLKQISNIEEALSAQSYLYFLREDEKVFSILEIAILSDAPIEVIKFILEKKPEFLNTENAEYMLSLATDKSAPYFFDQNDDFWLEKSLREKTCTARMLGISSDFFEYSKKREVNEETVKLISAYIKK